MKREILILCFIAVSFITKAQAYTVNLNGNDWPGYVSVCHGTSFHAIVTINGSNSSFSYLWLNADNSDTLSTSLSYVMPSGPGYYTFKILISGISDSEYDLLVFEDEELGTTLTKSVHGTTNITEWNGNDGWINSDVIGGTSPYGYLWSNGSTTANIDGLNAGIYTLTVQDDHGCTSTSSVTMTAPSGPLRIVSMTSPTLNNFNITEKGKADGKINLVVAGGGGQYKYKWYPYGNPTANPDTLTARKYTVVVSDTNDAEVTQSITLNEPNKLEVTLSIQNANCNGCSNGSITANATGGVPNYSYLWSTGQTTASISNLPAGDYQVKVTDANGAKVREAAFIKQPDQNGWLRTGNSGTNPNSDFIGTTDNKDLVLRTNNTVQLTLSGSGGLRLNSFSGTGYGLLMVDSNGSLLRSPNGQGASVCIQYQPTAWVKPPNAPDDAVRCIGNVGIGLTNPSTTLEVKGVATFSATGNSNSISLQHTGTDAIIKKTAGGHLRIQSTTNISTINVNDDGQVGIGVDPSPALSNDYSLFVKKGIMAEKVMVALKGNQAIWPDYVFNKDYKLKSLDSLKSYLIKNKHLPDLPSAEENIEKGVDILKMQILQLKKIEELTLYVIQLKEENDKLRELISNK